MPKQSKSLRKRMKVQGGARNLVLLGVVSTLIAIMTTSFALAIYHNSGDIYLDRSRPGYLPDEEEIEDDDGDKDTTEEYDFAQSGEISEEGLDEFLRHLNEEVKEIDDFEKPFSEEVLSDAYLGIPVEEKAAEEKAEDVKTEEMP